jgi:hypothetical protein
LTNEPKPSRCSSPITCAGDSSLSPLSAYVFARAFEIGDKRMAVIPGRKSSGLYVRVLFILISCCRMLWEPRVFVHSGAQGLIPPCLFLLAYPHVIEYGSVWKIQTFKHKCVDDCEPPTCALKCSQVLDHLKNIHTHLQGYSMSVRGPRPPSMQGATGADAPAGLYASPLRPQPPIVGCGAYPPTPQAHTLGDQQVEYRRHPRRTGTHYRTRSSVGIGRSPCPLAHAPPHWGDA